MFWLRDPDGNSLLVVQTQRQVVGRGPNRADTTMTGPEGRCDR
jgi:hypothetical protein